ncbi:DUF2959 domain-containing protein [Candidatus Woesearchaeota archaeon]|nr:DUF2959 domain-containing protein [Candidatus Woesearchaeota archaeon]
MASMDDLAKKYVERINQSLNPQRAQPETSSKQYKDFKAQYLPKRLTHYERWCNTSVKIFSVSPSNQERPKLQRAINTCHLETTPEGIISFSLVAPMFFILMMAVLFFVAPVMITIITGGDAGASGSMFMLFFSVFVGIVAILPLQKLPYYLANAWRMKASNQMVLCVFYIVTYMRHTSNLELAIDFAGEHLAPPLSLDMKKIIWDIETERHNSIKESLDEYLEDWKEWNPEFIESMHLIEGSLLESAESRRVELLDKSLSVMLDETYEKMLHYAHNLKSPLTTLHMLGVILPILGLVILPLMVNFIPEVKWYHMAMMYNVSLPLLVYLLAKNILSTRPTGYGNTDITDINPELKRLKKFLIGGPKGIALSPFMVSALLLISLLLVSLFPIGYHIVNSDRDWVMAVDGTFAEVPMGSDEYKAAKFYFLNYREIPDPRGGTFMLGPYGLGAILFSLLLPLSLGLGIGAYYSIRSKDVIEIREETRKLEQEFASALFQLGNRLADGIPAEIAFQKVSIVLEGTRTAKFFDIVTSNITKLGMGIEDAIFDETRGAIKEYPSSIIESSMKVLVESSKKGPLIASRAVVNISEYIKQMHRVDERLKDLMSDVISSMKSQIMFLTPVIAGIVIGITSMISTILGSIGNKLSDLGTQTGGLGSAGAGSGLLEIFGQGGIPTYHFQAIVGIYVVQITYILTVMVNGIENGTDILAEEYQLGKNLKHSVMLYVIISAITIVLFGLIAGSLADI